MPDHSNYDPPGMTCSDGWRITGYFLPAEADCSPGDDKEITVEGVGKARFSADFLAKTKMEGWGLTTQGWYLGWSGSRWIKSADALNAHGKPLHKGSAATDPTVIRQGANFRVISALAPWNDQEFVADDTGGKIKGKHVDIYCGAGSDAEQETFRVTSQNGRVCM